MLNFNFLKPFCIWQIYCRSSVLKMYLSLLLSTKDKNSWQWWKRCCFYYPSPAYYPSSSIWSCCSVACLQLPQTWCSVTTFTWQEPWAETGDWPAVRAVPNCVRRLMHPADTGLLWNIWCQPVMLSSEFSQSVLPTSYLYVFAVLVYLCRV